MGRYFSGAAGYGVRIPSTWVDDFVPANGWNEDDDIDTYLWEVTQKFGSGDLTYTTVNANDYDCGSILFVGKTQDLDDLGIHEFNPNTDVPSIDALEHLREACEYIGVSYEPRYLVGLSYC